MPPINTEYSLVRVATVEAGPYNTIQLLRSLTSPRSREGSARVYVMGATEAKQKAGRKVNTYELDGLLDLSDTTGQTVLRDAYENDTYIFAQLIYNDAATTGQPEGVQAKVKVTQFAVSGEREGDFVGVSFTLEGTGVTTELVAA